MANITSTYTAAQAARLDRVRGATSEAAFQAAATMKEVARLEALTPPVVVKWADHMGVNAGPTPSAIAIAKTVSLGLRWIQCSPERGWLTATQAAALVKQCHDAGLQVMIVCQEAGHQYDAVIANQRPFADYCASWVDVGANAIGLLNEPNNGAFWSPKPDVTMAGPALICAAALTAIRAKSKTIPVYLPGWSPAGDTLAPAACQKSIMARLVSMGFNPGAFTGAGHHPYCYDGPLDWGMPSNKAWNAFQQTPDVYAWAKAAGCSGGMSLSEYGCPSAGTEDGYPNTTFTEKIQAKVIGDTYTGLEGFMKAGLPLAYLGLSTAIDGEASTRPLEDTMGVFRHDGSEKPAAAVVRAQALKPFPVAA